MTRQIPVPSFRFFVAAAAAVSPMNGSSVWEYSLGNGPPPANGERRLVGMCVCSVTNKDSNPRSSTARASSSIRIE